MTLKLLKLGFSVSVHTDARAHTCETEISVWRNGFQGRQKCCKFHFFTNIWSSVAREGELLQGFAVFHWTPMVLVNTALQKSDTNVHLLAVYKVLKNHASNTKSLIPWFWTGPRSASKRNFRPKLSQTALSELSFRQMPPGMPPATGSARECSYSKHPKA